MLVLRQSNGKRPAAKFDVGAIQKGRADDPVLQSGDIVIAGRSAIKAGFKAILKALPVAGLVCFLVIALTRTMSANLAKDPNREPEGGQLVLAAQSLPARADPYGMLAGYPATGAETPGHSYLDIILEIWRIVYKRKWLIVSIAAAIFAIGAVRTLMEVPLYTATVRLQIDRNVAKIVNTEGVMPARRLPTTTSCERNTSC